MFLFRLQNALNFRINQEKIQIKQMAITQNTQMKIISKIENLQKDMEHASVAVNQNKLSGIFSIHELQMHQQFRYRMQHVLSKEHNKLQNAKQIVEESREKLKEVARARKMLETLKEKQEMEYLEKISRYERLETDEIASNIYNFKRRNI